jgi:hypothetical protein
MSMAKNVNNWDVEKVTLAVNGRVLTDFASGGKATAAWNTDKTSAYVGCDGGVVYQESADNTGTVSVTFRAVSSSLPYLKQLCESRAMCILSIMDMNNPRGVTSSCPNCRVTKVPDYGFNQTISDVTVTIYVPDLNLLTV